MTRKSPYEHKVKGHYRDGKFVEVFDRGTGPKPEQRTVPRAMRRSRPGTGYNVTFIFPGGGSESYNTGGTATGALKAAVSKIQRPELPKSATLRMIK